MGLRSDAGSPKAAWGRFLGEQACHANSETESTFSLLGLTDPVNTYDQLKTSGLLDTMTTVCEI